MLTLTSFKALPILKAAWDRGINTIDTANMYSNGDSEKIIGSFMKTVSGVSRTRPQLRAHLPLHQYNIPRENVVIMTKVFFLVSPTPTDNTIFVPHLMNSRDYINHSGLSRIALFNQVDASLKRLGTDYIDVLHVHTFDPTVPPEETMKALHDLVQSGKVRYLGASNVRAWQVAELNRVAELNNWTPIVCVQVEYSLLYRYEVRPSPSAGLTCDSWLFVWHRSSR